MKLQYADFFITIEDNLNVSSIYNNCLKTSKLQLKPELETKIREFDGQDSKCPEEIDEGWVRELGDILFESLFNGDVKDQFAEAMDEIKESDSSGLRILLKTRTAKYADFPWEASRYNGNYLSTDIRTPFVRLCEGGTIDQRTRPVEIRETKPRIFPILSNVSNYSGVETQVERDILEECYETEIRDFPAKISRIKEELRKARNVGESSYNIVHFLGHGSYDENKGSSLVLCSEDNMIEKFCEVNGVLLKEIFHNELSLGMFILNGCDTAKVSSSFSGLVPELLEMVPAVIAMRKRIHKNSAKEFSKCFYKNLVATNIEETIQYTRSDMHGATGFKMDFCIPVLYLSYNKSSGATKQVFARNTVGGFDLVRNKHEKYEQTGVEKTFANFIRLHDFFYSEFSIFLAQFSSVNVTIDQLSFLKNVPSMFMQPVTKFQTHITELKGRVKDNFLDEFPEWNEECNSIDKGLIGILSSIVQTCPEKLKEHCNGLMETYTKLEKIFSLMITSAICKGDKS